MVNKSIEEIITYLEGDGQIAIFDGSNLTKSRREHILELVKDHVHSFIFLHSFSFHIQPTINTPIWIEMRVKNLEIIMDRFDKNKLQSMEYLGYDMSKAKQEHRKRITYQQASYDPLEEDPLIFLF